MAKKIMLVDDHAIVRSGLRQFLAPSEDVTVECEASGGQEALDLLRTREIDGVMLDLTLPDRSGLDVLRHMRALRPDLPILILSMHDEDQYAATVLKAGANGYLSKSSTPDEVLKALRTVLDGGQYVSEETAQHLAAAYVDGPDQSRPHTRLSTREFEVFMKLAAGHSLADVASELFLSPKTVSTHRAQILSKMNMATTAELTYYAIKNQLLA